HVKSVTIEPWFQHETLEAHLYQDEPFVADDAFKDFLSDDLSALGPPTELLFLFRGYLEKLNITDQLRETWFHGLEAVDEDYEIALLLALMTNVEHLEITMPNYKSFMRPELLLVFPMILGDDSFLQHLHSIRVRAADHDFYDFEYRPEFEPYHGYPSSFFLPLLALPSLRSAEIKDAFDMLDPIVEYTDLVQDHHLMFEKIRIDPWNLNIAWRYQQDDENPAFGHRGGKSVGKMFWRSCEELWGINLALGQQLFTLDCRFLDLGI
ncbi:hypothetical protein D6C90_10487, partial [Aureobasidium pullulans]